MCFMTCGFQQILTMVNSKMFTFRLQSEEARVGVALGHRNLEELKAVADEDLMGTVGVVLKV